MVGEKINLSQITGKYVGRPFEQASCMGLLHGFFTDLGVDVPSQFGGLNLDTYFAAWEKDKKGTIQVMLDLFETLGDPVADFDRLERFDLLAIQETFQDKQNIYPGVYLGNDQAIASNLTKGVRVFYIGKVHAVIMARRFECLKR